MDLRKNWGCFPEAWIVHGQHELNPTLAAMIENERLELPDFSLDMDLSPSSILLIPVVARLSLATFRFGLHILFTDPSNAFLFCMALGILTYKTIIHSSLISGIVLGLSSRVVITYFFQGRRWTIICGYLLGVFASDVVTLFWNYVNQYSDPYERDGGRRRRKSTRTRRLSDPRPPNPAWSSLTGKQNGDALQTPSDQDVASLKRRLAQAEATVRRVQEERKWAISQGNNPRAMQLKWQNQRNEALVRNYSRELEEKQPNTHNPSTTKHVRQISDSITSNGDISPTGKRVVVAEVPDSVLSDGDEHVRMHTRQHLHQRFTLEDGSEVQLTQLHLGRTKEKESERLRGRSVPVTIIESPTKETSL